MDRISPNLKNAFILTRSTLGMLLIIFICTTDRVMTVDLSQNFVSVQYLENKWTEFHQTFDITINTDKILVGIVSCHFSQICKSYGP